MYNIIIANQSRKSDIDSHISWLRYLTTELDTQIFGPNWSLKASYIVVTSQQAAYANICMGNAEVNDTVACFMEQATAGHANRARIVI